MINMNNNEDKMNTYKDKIQAQAKMQTLANTLLARVTAFNMIIKFLNCMEMTEESVKKVEQVAAEINKENENLLKEYGELKQKYPIGELF